MAEKHDINQIADLACLKIEDSQQSAFQGHFDKILDYFQTLENLDTENVEPMITPHGLHSPLRADEVKKDLSVEEVLQNAPDVKDSLFKVPPVV